MRTNVQTRFRNAAGALLRGDRRCELEISLRSNYLTDGFCDLCDGSTTGPTLYVLGEAFPVPTRVTLSVLLQNPYPTERTLDTCVGDQHHHL